MILGSCIIGLLFAAFADHKSGIASAIAMLLAAGFFAFSLYAFHAGL